MKKIYYNGSIITMENNKIVDTVLIEDDLIKSVGLKEEIIKNNAEAQLIDLNGKTMLPAFIDAHSHFSATANSFLQVSLEETTSVEEIIKRINSFIEINNMKENQWIVGKGYDHNDFINKKHPTCFQLDNVKGNFPIIIQHKSGHAGVFNSKGLELMDININTKSPSGGVIGKDKDKLTGYIEENAFMKYLKKIPMASGEELFNAFCMAQERYLSYGITTVQEGMMVSQVAPLYEALIDKKIINLDVVGYSAVDSVEIFKDKFSKSIKKYDNNFKVGGYKIFLDGSPQARTAWMRKPYLNDEMYLGYGTMEFKDVCDAVREAAKNNMQILAHCNGDAAAKQYIDAIDKIKNEGYDVAGIRPVMIHAQFLDRDQLDKVKELGIIPSFFVAHVYYWGDVHISNFGLERASRISLSASSLKKDIKFTFHQDSPVIEPNMIETIHVAVNRVTKKGISLGKDERIPVYEALKAVTINAAYQYFEEDKKGSIEVGKKADFVILDKNPLEIPIENIKEIKVVETIKDGNTLYRIINIKDKGVCLDYY
ncbi:amidohydrolase [Clostridium butyricum]|uniref:amidohydrolase n=2 Tax=Clostridium butyricum TaxID=1492 RepID=UPI002ABE2070|nr:amidohydrolase [Clostridium butyricum]